MTNFPKFTDIFLYHIIFFFLNKKAFKMIQINKIIAYLYIKLSDQLILYFNFKIFVKIKKILMKTNFFRNTYRIKK